MNLPGNNSLPSSADAASRPIGDVRELEQHFASGNKTATYLGVEHERIGILANGDVPDFASKIEPLLKRMARQFNWETIKEDGRVIGLRRGQALVTIEPGGQVEFSDQPRTSAREVAAALEMHDSELAAVADELGIIWLGAGFRPVGHIAEAPWMPKGRYAVMRAYFHGRGRLAHEMMQSTAAVQVNLDYRDQADAAEKMRLAMSITSLVTALWSNSPLREGRPAGYQSYRAACWRETDEERCGLLPFVFAAQAPERLFADYADWALDVPMIFLRRGARYLPVENMTFRRFVTQGIAGERATMVDWENHLSTLFPEARLKLHLEMRGADAGSWGMVKALAALCRGLFYDADSCINACNLMSFLSYQERLALHREVPRLGLQAQVRSQPILPLARELVAIAREGLQRLGDDAALLDPVEEIARSGRTCADRMMDLYERAAGNNDKLIAGLRLDGGPPATATGNPCCLGSSRSPR